MATKIRLVRCPKCRLVLPELPEFNVYKCGGCGTTLQAKHRVNDAKSTSSGSTDVDGAVLKKQSSHVHEDEESCSSSIKDVLPGSGEDCSDENNGRDQGGPGECDSQSIHVREDGESCSSSIKDVLPGSGEDFSDENNGRDQGGSGECDSQSSHVHEDGGSCSSSIKDVLPGSGEDCSDENNERDQDRSGECDSEQLGVVNLLTEDLGNGRHQSDFSDCQHEPSGVSNKVFPSTESDDVNEELGDDKNEKFDHNRNGEVSNNGNEEVAYNGNEQIADNGSEDQSNGSHQSDSSDCQSEPSGVSNKVFPSTESDDVNEELADVKNQKFDHNGNGEVSNNGNEEVAYNGNEQIADNGSEEFSHSEIEEFSDNGNEQFDDNGNEEFAHEDETADSEVAANNESLPLAEADSEVAANDESLLSSEEDSEIAANSESLPLAEADSELAASNESLPLAEADSKAAANEEILSSSEADSEVAANDESFPLVEADSELTANDESLPLAEADSEVPANDESLPLAEADSEVSANDESLLSAEADSEVSANDESLLSAEADSEVAAKDESLSSAEADSEVATKDENLPLAEENTTYNDKNFDSDSNFRSSNNISLVAPVENGSTVSVQKLVRESRESIPSDTLASTPGEHLEESQTSVQQGFNPVGSVITSDNAEFNPSSEFSGAFGDMSKSPTRSSRAYDGSISSFDGMDDQFPNHHTPSFQDTYNAVNFAHSAEIRRRDELRAKSMMKRDSELQNQARHSCSDMNSKWDRDEFLKAARYGHMVRNRTGPERDEYRSRLDFGRASFQGSYENVGPIQLQDKFYHRKSSFQSYDGSENPELDKLKLLRMVFELQEQLMNTRHLHEKENDSVSGFSGDARYPPGYRNYKSPSEELYQHSNYPRYTERYTAGSNYSQRRRSKKIPFSGEATSSSHQYDSSYSHCLPEDWQRSAQLPRPSLYYNSGLCRIHPGHNYCTCYSSAPPSPQWSVETDIWGHETKSGDQRRRSREVKSYLKEKQHLVKRHFRPISGAAPFVACYNCFRVLQLPADFLLFKRRCHKLRCGACSKVLEFSLQNRSHIVPYTFNAEDPPTSEAEEDHGDFVRRTSASASQVHNYTQHRCADPVSCSDDYGLSYCRSCSTEGEPVYNTPSHTPQHSVNGRKILNDSLNPKRVGKALSSQQSREKYKKPVVGYETAGPSSSKFKSEKSSSEIEELSQKPTSPLHRLMGYSSPSEVIYGAWKSGQGTSS